MDLNDVRLNIAPTLLDLQKIKEWLIKEQTETNEGFYCNWVMIEKALSNGKLMTLVINDTPIGFIVWSIGEIHIEIDILEIHPKYRKKGFGKIFFELSSNFFKQKEFIAIKLFCKPIESEEFWKNMGFVKFPQRGYSERNLTYFKPLISTLSTLEKSDANNRIELWNVEAHLKNEYPPKWIWNIKLENNKLVVPIIQPCNSNWNMKWIKKGKIIKEGRVKHFSTKENRIDYSPFIYIKEIGG
jgi:GNAT superfamily N-acetyltransferase